MELPIFFIDTDITPNVITLSEDASRHIVQVLRMRPQERLLLTDGAGTILTGEIIDAHKKNCLVEVRDRQFTVKKQQQVSVAISLLKNGSRFEWFLEKATEIGVTEIIPLLCERTEKQHFRFDRVKHILISAMIQSRQAWLPTLHEPEKTSRVISRSAYETKLIAHCQAEVKSSIVDFRKSPSVQILIGPEGDFTIHEICAAVERSFKPVSLGETRLRAETAGAVAATILCV